MKLKEFFLGAAAIAFFALNASAQTAVQLQAEIVLLKAQVAALQTQTAGIQRQVTQTALNPVLALGPFVTVDLSPENGSPGPNIVFHGVNVHIVDGLGLTATTNGLGNLFIGYNESFISGLTQVGWIGPADRLGSHNQVVGRCHKLQELLEASSLANSTK
jgi:hypothetical protein